MKLEIKNLKIRSMDVDRNEVTWEVGDTADALDFRLQVFRSESPLGPFDPVSPTFEDRYIFVDARLPQGDKFRQLWYRIRSTHKQTGEHRDSDASVHEPEPDLIANYIRRMEQVLFSQITGRRCWLFKKRTFGPRCPSCFDRTTGQRLKANCITCFDTGFLRGYLDPIELYVQIDPPGKGKQNQPAQISQEVVTSARMGAYPNVSPGDVLVESENRRWRISRVRLSERLRAPIKQDLVMRQIESTDIEYKLPMNLDRALTDIQPSPPRMFINAHNLESEIVDATPDVFANYRTYPKDPNAD